MRFHNKFLGSDQSNVVDHYVGGDLEEMFLENLKKCKDDWYYKNVVIDYDINKNGHRCKNIDEMDLDNYVLFTGCSHTYGVGLELENTYPYLVSKALNCDYYNLAISGAGIDALEYNLLSWLGLIPKKPKMIFLQMPDHTRFAGYNPYVNSDDMFFSEKGSWVQDLDEIEMVVNCEKNGVFNARKLLAYKLLDNVTDIPIIKANIWAQDNISVTGLKMRPIDKARDLSHFGIESNRRFADDIVEYLKQVYPNLIPE